ncbi:MAG: TonB-dependent siderophore receptor [Oceanicaulis sp.]
MASRTASVRRFAALLLASSALSGPAFAQEAEDGEASASEDVITVYGSAEFFRPTTNTSATKIPLPIVETPQAITVLTRDVLDLTGARDLEDVSSLVPGVVFTGTYGGFDNRFNFRGFALPVDKGVLINGISVASNVDRDFLGVERLEYLRGPTGIVQGTLNFGGAVNIITRRPDAEFGGSVQAEVGSFELFRVQAEVTGALNQSETVRAYAGAAYEDRGGFREAEGLTKIPLRFALDVDFSPSTMLTIDAGLENGDGDPIGTFSRDYSNVRDPLPTYIPRSWNPCAATSDCKNDYENREIVATLTHEFGNGLYARGTLGYNYTERAHRFVSFLGVGFPERFATTAPGPYGFWYTYDDTDSFETFFGELAFGGEFEAFGQTHDFLLLAERREREVFQDYQLNDPSLFFVQFASIFDFGTDLGAGDMPVVEQPTFSWDNTTRDVENTALTAQVILRPVDRLQVLLGARYEEEDFTEVGINNGGAGGPFGSSYDVDVDSGVSDTVLRAGLVYEVLDGTFAYASYSEGFFPVRVLDDAGQPIPSEEGTQYEIGVKGEYLGGALGFGAAAFLIERDNVPTTVGDGVLSTPASRAQEHRGFELEVLGKPFDRLNLIATYAYLETEITRSVSEPALLGNEIALAPNHLASIFAQYDIPWVEGLSIGGGVRYVGEQFADADNTPEVLLPSYTLVEANLNYQVNDQVTFQLIGKNLTDEKYFTQFGGSGFFGWTWGEPSTFLARVTAEF